MSQSMVENVRIAGIACVVPNNLRTVSQDAEIFGPETLKLSESTGVKQRYVASETQCTSDLCFAAAQNLLEELKWDKNSIDGLIFVTQTPDYILPATACVLQERLGLSKNCFAYDVNMGCSGYIYGLWLVSSVIRVGGIRRVLVLVGDTSTKLVSSLDKSVVTLFGDAGTATAVELTERAAPIYFKVGTDGGGAKNLIVPAGQFRQRCSDETKVKYADESGNLRSAQDLYMNGPEIFAFVLREIPSLIMETIKFAQWDFMEVEGFVFHQANKFILDYMQKRLKIPPEKLFLSIGEFGNTSSSSIPLTLVNHFTKKPIQTSMKLVLCGFGVGYSWGAAALEIDQTTRIVDVIKAG